MAREAREDLTVILRDRGREGDSVVPLCVGIMFFRFYCSTGSPPSASLLVVGEEEKRRSNCS